MFLIISCAFVKAYQDTQRKMSHAVDMKQNMSIVLAFLSSLQKSGLKAPCFETGDEKPAPAGA